MKLSMAASGGGVVLAALFVTPIASGQELLHEVAGKDLWVLGQEVASLPDVDGDGVRDFAVGAPGFRDRQGMVAVHSGRTGARLYRILGPTGHSGLGWFGDEISPVGDVDGDGVPDLVIGNDSYHDPYQYIGSVQVHSGVDGVLIHRVVGDERNLRLGISATGLDDVNGDGVADFAASTALGTHYEDYVKVYSGLDASLLYEVVDTRDGWFGACLAAFDDVDGDGVGDLAVGTIRSGRPGLVSVHSGLSGARLWRRQGDLPSDQFGFSLAATTDRTGDGVGELLVGAPGPYVEHGYVRILSGSDGAAVARIQSPQVGDRFGHAVATAGDVNGDGVEDLLIGAHAAVSGRAELYSGASLRRLYRFRDRKKNDALGIAVAGLDDLDGDGLGEVIVGAPWAEPEGIPYQGAARVYRGNDLYLDPSEHTVQVGDVLSLLTREGTRGLPVALFLTSVDGVPTFQALAAGTFNGTGSFRVAGSSCPALAGHVLGLRSLALGPSGPSDSIDELVAFR